MIEDVQEKHVGKWRQDEMNFTYTYYYICNFRCSLTYNIGGKNVTAIGTTKLKVKNIKPLPTTTTSTTTEITTEGMIDRFVDIQNFKMLT